MPRIIIEEMRVNKKKPPVTIKKVDTFSTYKEVEKFQEEKINEHFKNKEIERRKVERIGKTPRIRSRPKIIHKSTIIIFIICMIIGSIYWGGNIFQKANINITLKREVINYNNKEFIASKSQDGNPINFEIMIISDKKIKSLILTDTKEVSSKAKGIITLYNEFSATPEKIIAGSFVADSDGRAYKTDKTITIPGYKLDSSKKIIPGNIDVNITSFLTGDTYNGKPADFFISAFKGTTKYNKIYGKLKSDLTGGAEGLVYILNDTDKKNLDTIVRTSLKDDLYRQVKAQVPVGYLLYPDAITFSYKTDENVLSKTKDAKIEVEGLLSVVLLKEKSLIDNIIKTSLPNIKGEELNEVTLPDLGDLYFSFGNKEQAITKEMEVVPFLLNGKIDAIWNPDINLLKTKLLGIGKSNVAQIFKQDPGISSAVLKISPPWKKNVPNDLSKININIK